MSLNSLKNTRALIRDTDLPQRDPEYERNAYAKYRYLSEKWKYGDPRTQDGFRKINLKENNMSLTIKAVRQGEVLLVPVEKLPRGKVEKHTSFIVGHSETGHHHVLESKATFKVSEEDKQFVIELFESAKLVHRKAIDKHNTLTVAPGKYRVIYKTEYNPWEKVISEVAD